MGRYLKEAIKNHPDIQTWEVEIWLYYSMTPFIMSAQPDGIQSMFEEDYFWVYTIQDGDNLTDISEKFGIPIDVLVDLNNIEDKHTIYAGEQLIVGFTPGEDVMELNQLLDEELSELREYKEELEGQLEGQLEVFLDIYLSQAEIIYGEFSDEYMDVVFGIGQIKVELQKVNERIEEIETPAETPDP